MDTFRESLSKFDPYRLEAEQKAATDVRDSKIASLQAARQNKATRFTGASTPAPVWGSAGIGENDLVKDNYVNSEDGYRDGTANKIFNDYSWEEIDYIKDRVNDEYGIVQVEDGSFVKKKDGTPFQGDLSHYASLYKFKTFDGNDKIGMSSFLSPTERYDEDRLKEWGTFIGDKGVDKSQLVDNVLLPRPLTVRLEGIYNGSSDLLNRRAVRQESGADIAVYNELRNQYGTGATEIYRPISADERRVLSTEEKDKIWNNFNETFRPGQRGQYSTEEVAAILKKKYYEESSAISKMLTRTGNAIKGAGSTAALELIVKPADMVAEWFGSDIGTAEELTAIVDGFYGYDRSFSAEDMEKVHGHVSNLYVAVKNGEDIDMADIYSTIGTIATNPELLAEVFAGTMSFLVGFGKFTKVGKATNLVRKEYQAGNITKEVAQKQIKQIKKDHTLLNNVAHVAASNVGLGLVTAGMVNTNIDEFKENNNGEATAGDIVRITALTSLSSVIEKTAGMFVLRDFPGIKQLGLGKQAKNIKDAVKDMSAAEYATFYNKLKRAATTVAGVTTTVGASAVSEGVTEYVQTLVEITSTKYMTEKYGSDLAEILSSRESQIDAFTGLALGAVTGGEMSGIGAGTRAGVNRLANQLAQRPQRPTNQVTEETTTDIETDEVAVAYENYKTTSDSLKAVTEINEDNLSAVLKDIGEAKNLAEVASILDPALAAETNERVKALEAMIADRIEGSNGGLSIKQALAADKETRPLSDESTKILASRAVRMVVDKYEGEVSEEVEEVLYSFARNNKISKEEAKNIIKSYASVESEATIEDRGVRTRDERLTLYLDSDNPDPAALKREYKEITNFYRTTEESIAQLTEGLKKAEEEAQKLQARLPKGGKSKTITTDYMTDPKSSSQGAPFTISVSYKNGTWGVAQGHIAEVNKRIEAKQRTSSSLVKLLERYHQEATEHLDPASMLSFNEYRITTPPKNASKGVQQEQNYIKAVTEKVRDVLGLPTARINKVIIGKSVDSQWEPTSRRAQENARITNVVAGNKGSADYSASDVVYLHTNNSAKTREDGHIELNNPKSSLAIELDAAIRAGATIVLSNSNRVSNTSGKETDPNKNRGVSLSNWLKKKGYMSIGPSKEERDIFVPVTDEIKARYDDLIEKNKEAAKKKAKQARLEDKIVNLAIERRNKKLYGAGRVLPEISAEIKDIAEQLTEQFTPLAKSAVEREIKQEIEKAKAAVKEGETFDEKSVTPTEEQIKERVATKIRENINSFLGNAVDKNIKEARDLIANNTLTLAGIENEALRNLVEKSIEAEQKRTKVSEDILSAWSEAAEKKLSDKDTLEQLNESVKDKGIKVVTSRTENPPENAIVLSGVGNEILNNALTAGNASSIYFVTYLKKGPKGEDIYTTVPYYSLVTRTKVDGVTTTVEREVGYKSEKHGTVTKISQYGVDPTTYVKVSKPTPLNTLPVNDLPEVFRDIAKSAGEAFKAVIAPLADGESAFSASNQKDTTSLYNLADSPARTLVYDKKGEVNDNVLAAMGIAVRSYMERNKRNMVPGYKKDEVIAAMFGITEDNITEEHREFAYANGVLAKTAINDIGKSVLTALGMSKIKDTKQNRDLYARLVADLGNMAVLTAQHEKLLSTKDHNTNEYAMLTRKGKTVEGDKVEATVAFLEVANKDGVTETGFKRKVATLKAEHAIDQQAQVEEFIEDAVGARKEPYFGQQVPEPMQKELTRTVRNDITGAGVPADAAGAMKLLMNTKNELNTDVFNDLIPHLETEEGKVKVMERMGFITIREDNPKYMELTFKEKEVQESINRDIEKSVDELVKLHNKIEDGTVSNSIFYPVAFSKVQRYEYVSNTVNSQSDKFHRFLVTPASFRLEHKIDRTNNTFTYTYKDGKETVTKDTSLLIRAALSQAFGIGIDKVVTMEMVDTGNDLLAMTYKEVLEAEAHFMETGEFVFHNNEETVTLKPDHFGHALVAIKFLKDFTEDPTNKSVTSSLSMEYDAITSGFGNKIQQFALIDNLNEEARKVGIIKNVTAIEGLSEGEGLNDMFADKQFSDNYQSLGRTAVGRVAEIAPTLDAEENEVFLGIKKLLPGNELYENPEGDVSKALRNLFKPPFMTFNYAASIASIRKAMNKNIVETIYKGIAKADLNTDTDVKEVADYLAKIVRVNGEKVDAEKLQAVIRNIDSKYITVTKTRYKSGAEAGQVTDTVPLETYLTEGVLDPTYGEAVKGVFEEKYANFIEIQNTTNDAFQAAFAVFNQLLVQKVKNHWEANNRTVTEEGMSRFIDELRPAFPAIAGPLSEAVSEGIHIYDVDTLTPNALMATTPSPQTKLKKAPESDSEKLTKVLGVYVKDKTAKGKADTRKVNMLIKSITASTNAGAVSPFLGIDGAQLATMINKFHEHVLHSKGSAEIIPLHDAYIAPLHLMDEAGYQYNKNTVELHKRYSIMAEVLKMVEVADNIVHGTYKDLSLVDALPTFLDNLKINNAKDSTFNTEVQAAKEALPQLRKRLEIEKKTGDDTKISATLQQIADVEAVLSFDSQVKQIKNRVTTLNDKVNVARESMYGDGDVVSPMVGLGDSAYVVGREENRAGTAIADHYRKIKVYTADKRKGKAEDLGSDHKIGKISHESTRTDVYSENSYHLLELKSKKQAKKLFKIASKAIDSGSSVLFNTVRDTGANAVYNNLLEQGIATSKHVKVNGKEYLLMVRTESEAETVTGEVLDNTTDSGTEESVDVIDLSDSSVAELAKRLGIALDIKKNECS